MNYVEDYHDPTEARIVSWFPLRLAVPGDLILVLNDGSGLAKEIEIAPQVGLCDVVEE